MSTKCFTCKEPIINGDFIKCEGICAQKFHSKCVAINKTTLNAITSCPNIHWLCHECNNGNKTIGASIDNMSNTLDKLTSSLSSDLLAGFKLLTDSLSTKLSANNHSSMSSTANGNNPPKRRRNDVNSESESDENRTIRRKRFAAAKQTNNKQNGLSFATTLEPENSNRNPNQIAINSEANKRKSVVISNIDKGVTPEHLSKYLSNELDIDETTIRTTTLLKPAGIADESVKFLQFRISIPEENYSRVRAQSTWPNGVRVRDYVFNRRSGGSTRYVSKENFLSIRASHAPIAQQTITPIEDSVETVMDIEIHSDSTRQSASSTPSKSPIKEVVDSPAVDQTN